MSQLLSIVIPVYNECETLVELLGRVLRAPLSLEREILIVNDGSTDESASLAQGWVEGLPAEDAACVVLLDKPNGGKGSAVRMGIEHSRGDVVIIQDADLEYNPADYQACVAEIIAGRELVVYGSRERFSENRLHSSLSFYAGGLAVTYWMNLLYGSSMTDEPTCYKTFHGPLIRALSFQGNQFEWEPEVTAKLLRLGIHIHEVPISYMPRKVNEGKKINWRDGVQALTEAFYWRFMPMAQVRKRLLAVPELHERLPDVRLPWALMVTAMVLCGITRLGAGTNWQAGIFVALSVPPVLLMSQALFGRERLLVSVGAMWFGVLPAATAAATINSARACAVLWAAMWLMRFMRHKRLTDFWLAGLVSGAVYWLDGALWCWLAGALVWMNPGKSLAKRLLGSVGWVAAVALVATACFQLPAIAPDVVCAACPVATLRYGFAWLVVLAGAAGVIGLGVQRQWEWLVVLPTLAAFFQAPPPLEMVGLCAVALPGLQALKRKRGA